MHVLIGTTVRASPSTMKGFGEIHTPTPVLVGDVAVFAVGPAHEIISVFHADDMRPLAAKLRPVKSHAARR